MAYNHTLKGKDKGKEGGWGREKGREEGRKESNSPPLTAFHIVIDLDMSLYFKLNLCWRHF